MSINSSHRRELLVLLLVTICLCASGEEGPANMRDAKIATATLKPTTRPLRVDLPAPGKLQRSNAIRVCQVGYLPAEKKFAMLSDALRGDVLIRRVDTDAVVLSASA